MAILGIIILIVITAYYIIDDNQYFDVNDIVYFKSEPDNLYIVDFVDSKNRLIKVYSIGSHPSKDTSVWYPMDLFELHN
jgi:hypothetical protein